MKKFTSVLVAILLALMTGFYACDEDNQPPNIQSISANPDSSSDNRIPGGTVVQLNVVASDPDGDPLTYSWSANGGEFVTDTDKATVSWQAPVSDSNKYYFIEVNVSDGKHVVSRTINIWVASTVFGSIKGYVYYADTTIPVSGVLVSIAGKTSTTGSDGSYKINDIQSGVNTLKATKEGFDEYSTNVEITSGIIEHTVEMTSYVYAHNLKGIVTSINLLLGSGPLALCQVVVLNPDGSESDLKSQTSSTGFYQIPSVPQGNRTVRFTAENHETLELNIFMANSDYELDMDMQFIYLGYQYYGGIIAYVLQPNDPGYIAGQLNGLIAAPSDLGSAKWGCSGTEIGETSTALGTGASNTAAIVAGCSESGIAARMCYELELNGYSDWFLPSRDELNKLYQNRNLIGGFESSWYWSSSEYSSSYAWIQGFYNGNQDYIPKSVTYRVRAVRAF